VKMGTALIKNRGVPISSHRGYREGSDLKNMDKAFNRLSPHVPKFLRSLAEKVVPKGKRTARII
jgi:hypothetical protein